VTDVTGSIIFGENTIKINSELSGFDQNEVNISSVETGMNQYVLTQTMKIIQYTKDPASGPLLRHGGRGVFNFWSLIRRGGGDIYHNLSIEGTNSKIAQIKMIFNE
jgi:hypothetical protein